MAISYKGRACCVSYNSWQALPYCSAFIDSADAFQFSLQDIFTIFGDLSFFFFKRILDL